MGKFVVRQPDGQYAVFSTVVDDFVVLDASTAEEAVAAADGAGVGKITWCGTAYATDDPDGELWGACLMTRVVRCHEPGWPETTRLIADIMDRALVG